ncbi:MAG: hypothetical protein Q6354_09115, partial [Candidatus Brocadiales bacterium]|nr:hypothetical protein [Candidatus Brocadiales bacterium]
MWRVGVYLVLMFALANLPQARLVISLLSVVGAVAGEDKPQAEKGVAEKASPEPDLPLSGAKERFRASPGGSGGPTPEEKTSDKKDEKPVPSPGEGVGAPSSTNE